LTLIIIFAFCRDVDLFNKEHLTPEFIKINPTSTVPALIDGDTKVFDSSAIAIYLSEKYGKDDSLYPKDLVKRTKVNEMLFYVSSYMFPRIYQIFVPGYFGKELEVPQEKLEGIYRGYQTIETFLQDSKFLAGDSMTLCDLSLWTIMESLAQIILIDTDKYPKFIDWLEKMREHPTYELNKQGADTHIGFYRQCIAKATLEASQGKN
jgi:glutathione S-transferase